MTYETDLRGIYGEFKKFLVNNLEPTEEDFRTWLKYAYIRGRQANA